MHLDDERLHLASIETSRRGEQGWLPGGMTVLGGGMDAGLGSTCQQDASRRLPVALVRLRASAVAGTDWGTELFSANPHAREVGASQLTRAGGPCLQQHAGIVRPFVLAIPIPQSEKSERWQQRQPGGTPSCARSGFGPV